MGFLRYDAGRLARAGKTPSGGARIRANMSRTGIQTYRLADGSVRREYRPAEEVFARQAADSFSAAPITVGHPSDAVTPANWAALSAGVVTGAVERVRGTDGNDWAVAA